MGGMDNNMMSNEGQSVLEMMIPGTKVGLVIGKGGDTIKQLQVRLLHCCRNTHIS